MTPARLLGTVAELFTQKRAAAMARRAGEERRARLATALALANQRAEAGETLWALGQPAEGIRLMVTALQAALDLAAELPPEATGEEVAAPADRPRWLGALVASGCAPHDLAALQSAVRTATATSLPERDAQTSAEHEELYRAVRDATRTLIESARPFTATAGELLGRRIARIGGLAAALAVLTLAIVLALR